MFKSIHNTLADIFCDHVRQLRKNAGMSQRELAKALGRERGLVSRIEDGERRVDLPEAYELFKALGANPEMEAAELMRKFARTNAPLSRHE